MTRAEKNYRLLSKSYLSIKWSKLALNNAAKKDSDMIQEWQCEEIPSIFLRICHRKERNLFKHGLTTVEQLNNTSILSGMIGLQVHAHVMDRSERD